MWRRSFVATSVALGATLDETLAALPPASPTGTARPGDAELASLTEGLRAPRRQLRAAALAKALGEIALGIRQSALR